VPVEFLAPEQRSRYGCYVGEPSPEQLALYFHLDDRDRALLEPRRHAHTRLGFALQLCTVRFLGTFLSDPTDVPHNVMVTLASQLNIADWTILSRYREGEMRYDHVHEIMAEYGYQDFVSQPEHFRFLRWLYTRAWWSEERLTVLFDLAMAHLINRKVLLPGASVLERAISSVREHASRRLWQVLAAIPTPPQRALLETLLEVPPGERQTPLDRLRRGPTRVSGPALVSALHRVEAIRLFEMEHLDLSFVPRGRLKALARHATTALVQHLRHLAPDRRIATLLAFTYTYLAVVHDDALDLFDVLMRTAFSAATREGQQERLRTIHDLDAAAQTLAQACQVILDEAQDPVTLLERVYACVPAEHLRAAVTTVGELTRPPDDTYAQELVGRFLMMRRFLPTFWRTLEFESTPGGRPTLQAIQFLQRIEGRSRTLIQRAPRAVIPRSWQRYVLERHPSPEPGQPSELRVNHQAYTVCVVERLHEGLRRHDVFVEPSEHWGDPRAKLLQPAQWEEIRAQICHTLGREMEAERALESLSQQLEEVYQRTAANVPTNAAFQIEQRDGRDIPNLERLERIAEPESLRSLREYVGRRLPPVGLPEIILEVAQQTGFFSHFTHVSDSSAHVEDLPLSLSAVLLAEACNIGLQPVIQPEVPALTRDRLSWVRHHFVRAETITRANACLVQAQRHIPLAQIWGGGYVASVDGLRFVVPVRSVNAGPSPHYFGQGRGVTYLNYTSDQFTGLGGLVIPGTIRDSVYVLEALLEQESGLTPTEIMSDTASYSDLMFGLFWSLGYQFSPRLAEMKETRFWRIDPAANYGTLNGLARHRINTRLIATHWDDILRVAGSLKVGTVHASTLIQALQRGGRPTTLARAIAELGRIAKTLYLLNYIDDEHYRRRIQQQLNRGEDRHSVARHVFHGQRGELRQRYRQGQEDQLGALGLVVNMIVLWNTWYIQDVLDELRNNGQEARSEDVERVAPLRFQHINVHGTYHFVLPESVAQGHHRPLRPLTASSEELF
jgi:TnpA family transposase